MRCEQLARVLAASPDAGVVDNERAREHAATCLYCQAELVRYRRLVRGLQSLRIEVVEPAPGLLSDVFDALEAAGERRAVRSLVRGRRVVYAGGVALVAATGVALAVVSATRSRRSGTG